MTTDLFFFFNDTATTEIYTLSLHDALPISAVGVGRHGMGGSPSRHHPAAAAETRRAGAHHRAPHQDPFQSRLSLADPLCRRLHSPALLKKPASYRTRTSNQNRGPALHVKCAQKSLPVCQGGRSAFQKIRCIAPAAKTSRLPTIPQPQSRTREKSGLTGGMRNSAAPPEIVSKGNGSYGWRAPQALNQ